MKGFNNLRRFTDISSKFFISEYGVLVIALIGIISFVITIYPFVVNSGLDHKTITIVVDKLLQTQQGQLAVKDKQLLSQDELIQQLTDAVIAIAQAAQNPPRHFSGDDSQQAWQYLTQGNTKPARAYLASLATYQKDQNLLSQAAVTTQHQGSFTYLNSVDEAVKIYNESISLDPNNPMNQVLKSYIEARKSSTHILTTGPCSPVLKDVTTGDINITGCDVKK
ncbi:MAG: hypothetical protein IMF12_03755 [Proteobacteria bacterium]|nr:hypothetical protein [Pseudomonadota bacterium]